MDRGLVGVVRVGVRVGLGNALCRMNPTKIEMQVCVCVLVANHSCLFADSVQI